MNGETFLLPFYVKLGSLAFHPILPTLTASSRKEANELVLEIRGKGESRKPMHTILFIF